MSTAQPQHTTPQSQSERETEVLIVGAGFAGIDLLHKLRRKNSNVSSWKLATTSGALGTATDTQDQGSIQTCPCINFQSQRSGLFPDRNELARYFEHMAKVLNIKKDVLFRSKVVSAQYVAYESLWNVKIQDGTRFTSRFLLLATRFASKPYIPKWPGADKFRGITCHSALWPRLGYDLTGKRVAIVGTGATGVQMA
ncbi:hypothetical protein E4U41_006499 [Claviceps citrina]|nr:hypothetical protein E4U41_006499 [Claviceps citrina]